MVLGFSLERHQDEMMENLCCNKIVLICGYFNCDEKSRSQPMLSSGLKQKK